MVSRKVERLEQAAQRKNPDHMLDQKEEWIKVRNAIVEALHPFPEAKLAVVEALKKLEGRVP